ncbi:MAG: hypothetical protein PVJ57_01580 [Phycisphaerae bacterium]|jgi:hypothetical protein
MNTVHATTGWTGNSSRVCTDALAATQRHAASAAPGKAAETPPSGTDAAFREVLATWLAQPTPPDELRVQQVRQQIAADTYVTEAKLDYVVDAILRELKADGHAPVTQRAAS